MRRFSGSTAGSAFASPDHPEGTLPVLEGEDTEEDLMKTNWQHQKDAITTDQKNLTDDQRIHEQDKQHFKASEKEKKLVPDQTDHTDGEAEQ
jgi:hypothetical protein